LVFAEFRLAEAAESARVPALVIAMGLITHVRHSRRGLPRADDEQ
jgi:hypothetical protein